MFKTVYPAKKNEATLKGFWTAVLTDESGNVKQKEEGYNVITEGGLSYLASYLYSGAGAASTFTMKYCAIGTDATGEAASNTALGSESSRTTGTVSYVSAAIYQVIATFAAGSGTGAITEYGLFSSSANGTMLCRDTKTVINKGASDTLTVTAQITLA